MKNFTILFILLTAFQATLFSQSCLPEGIKFHSQAEIDSFSINYPGCKEIEGDVIISFYPNDINNLNGLNQITAIGGKLYISCDSLRNLTGLDSLTFIGGDVYFYSDDSLSDLTGLGNLTFIGGDLDICWCYDLTDLTALNNLTFIGGALRIYYNSSLTSLSGFENLAEGSITYLQITDNQSLSVCEAQWMCDYLSNPNGPVEIYDNAPGCNKPPEIAIACGITDLCLPHGNYYFYSQADIDIFQSDYPSCTDLEGKIIIQGGDINNLIGLNNLTSIGGTLEITSGWDLKSLTGLEGVTTIGTLYLISDQLTNLSGLNGLTTINGNLLLNTNLSLQNLAGLEGVNFIGGDVSIYRNFALKDLTGLEGLVTIGGDLYIGYIANFGSGEGNDQMTSLTGLDNLTSIGGDLEICYNEILFDVTALGNLTSIGGNLCISNGSLYSLAGLDSIAVINRDLIITNNPYLTNLTGLANIEGNSVSNINISNNSSLGDCDIQSICEYLSSPDGTVKIFNNAEGCNSPADIANDCGIILPCLPFGNYYFLTQTEVDSFQTNYPGCTVLQGIVTISDEVHNLHGLGVLTSIDGTLYISNADNLTSLTGLENLSSIDGNFYLRNNSALTNLTGLNNMDSIGGSFYIEDDNSMSNMIGLENLKSIGGGFFIRDNKSLIDLTGLENLISIDSNLEISCYISGGGNPKLNTISGLINLTFVSGDLIVGYNDELLNLDGLDNLTSVGGKLNIESNKILATLSALENLTTIGGALDVSFNNSLSNLFGLDNIAASSINNLNITYNPSLTTCEVESICNYLADPNGTIEIHDNGYCCDSQHQVEFYCGVGIGESAVGGLQSAVRIYPNPSTTQITIETTVSTPKFQISIFNLKGEEVISQRITASGTAIDISHLQPGLYFVKLTSQDMVKVLKLVKE